jgi:transposase InsO family protein
MLMSEGHWCEGPPETSRRYSRPVPGDRIQVDTMKVTAGRFQYTAIEDCTRLRVLGLYPRRTASNTVHFLTHRMIEEFPFPIQRVQTDRGSEFFGMTFQEALQYHCIKFRPNRPPGSPSQRQGRTFTANRLGGILFHRGHGGSDAA